MNHGFGCYLVAAAAPNGGDDRTGGINRISKYLYAVRRVGKHLKAWNEPCYYVIKWLLFGEIALAIWYAL